MQEAQRERLEWQLLAERCAILEDLAEFDERAREALQNDDGDLTHFPFHPADQAGDTEASELSFAIADGERKTLTAVDDALMRFYQAPLQFGRCGDCGREIPFERLDLVPWARRCERCEEAFETREAAAATTVDDSAGERPGSSGPPSRSICAPRQAGGAAPLSRAAAPPAWRTTGSW